MKVKIGESGADRKIEIPVSGKKYDSEEIKKDIYRRGTGA